MVPSKRPSAWRARLKALISASAALLLTAAITPSAAAVDVEEVRIVSELPDIVVGEVYGVEFEFYDAAGDLVVLQPGELIQIAPAGVFPCDLPACGPTNYTEIIETEAGRESYLIYIRSLVAGVNYLSITAPNGIRLQQLLNAIDMPIEPPPPEEIDPPTRLGIVSQPQQLEPGGCGEIVINFLNDAGEVSPVQEQLDVFLNPGGGVHPFRRPMRQLPE